MSPLLLTTSEPKVFSNCTEEYEPSRDDKYAECFRHYYDDCELLKDLHHARSFSHYALGVIPLIISIFAFLINVIFIYICLCIMKDKTNPCSKTYSFNFTRSISSIIGLIIYYCTLIIWKIDKLDKIPVAILFTVGCWSICLQAISYFCIARTVNIGSTTSPENYHLVFTEAYYLELYKLICILSIILSIVFGIAFTITEYLFDFNTVNILACAISVVALLVSISYSFLIFTNFRMMLNIRKLRNNNEENVTHINTKNNNAIYRLMYVTINCILTKFSLIVISVFCFYALYDITGLPDTQCQRFFFGKKYLKASIFGGITLFLIIIGMISDPMISFMCDFPNIKPLLMERYELWKIRLHSLKKGEQDEQFPTP